MFNRRFVIRQLTRSRQQSAIFVLCVALSIVSLAALRGFGESVNRVLLRSARQLIAADMIVRSNYAFSQPLTGLVAKLSVQGQVESARVDEFYSIARTISNNNSLLANLKVVAPGYPFYGEVKLASGRPFSDVLTPGNIVVEQTLLDRLNLQAGDRIRIGDATLTIRDVVLSEPDRPLSFFSLGPRIFVAAADLQALNLVKAGSRVTYSLLIKVNDEQQVDSIAQQIQGVLDKGQEGLQTYKTARSGVQRFYNNFLFFLDVVAIFTLLLSGIGIQGALTAYLRERRTTIAIIKTLGATRAFVYANYFTVVAVLGMAGIILGLGAGFALQAYLPILLGSFLPAGLQLTISLRAVAESVGLGVFVVVAFTFLPLYNLEQLKPNFIFRKETDRLGRGWPFYITSVVIVLFFLAMVLWQLGKVRTGLYFVGGAVGLILIAALLAEGTLRLLRRRTIRALDLRQALRGLFRPANATRSIIIALSAALAVLFCIYLVEQNLDATFVRSYPPNAPNLFFLDIQPDQAQAFAKALGLDATYYPVVQGTIAAVNGQRPVGDLSRRDGRDFEFSLTYRDSLLKDESVMGGGPMFHAGAAGAQVSVLSDVTDFAHIKLGDRVTFRIQGVPLDATVTSIRTRKEESFQPFFSFVFPTKDLKDAPQTIFTGVRVKPSDIAPLQNRLAGQFPNISAIDVTAAITTLAGIAQRLSEVIRFFTSFSVLAGILIIVSSVYATRFARIQEAAYYKVLGATSRFVLRVFALENLLLGLVSGILGVFMAQVGSWLIDAKLLDLQHKPFVGASLLMVVATMLLVAVVGTTASISILRRKPITYLREQSEEE